jgi:hypothetical protein
MKITDKELSQIINQIQTVLTRESSKKGEKQHLAQQLIIQSIIWGSQNYFEGVGILEDIRYKPAKQVAILGATAGAGFLLSGVTAGASAINPILGTATKVGSVGAGVTTANITGLLSSTYYYVWVRGNCGPTDKSVWTLEEAFSTECATPIVTSTTPVTRCGVGTATLSALPNVGSTINWYNVASGGSILFNGNNFTTPIVSSTTTYYAEAKAFGAVAKVGPTSPTNEGGTLGVQNFQGAVNFNVTSNTSLLSLDIYPMVSGQAGQIVLRNSSNVTLTTFPFTTTVSGGATAQVIPINYLLTAGNYNIFFATVPTSGVRMNTNNAFYPYNGSVANIQNNTFDNTQYLGLYNWRFTTECLSARVPVTVTVTAPPALTLSSTSSTICENYATPVITVSGYAAYNSLVW